MQLFRMLTLVLVAAILLSSCASHNVPNVSQRVDLLINNVTAIDAENQLRSDVSVLIQDGIITAVLPADEVPRISAEQVIDGEGKFLIPGLWDTHVHLTFDSEITDSMFRLFLANGITSVRDTGGQLDLVLAEREKSRHSLAPTVYIAGPLIDGVPTVYDGTVKGFPKIAITAATPAQVERAVDELAAAGVDLLKAYEMLSPESFKALLARAKVHGLPVTGHVPLSMTAQQAAAAGLRSMEHLRNVEMDCSSQSDALFVARQTMLQNENNKPGSALRSEIHGAQHFSATQSYDPERCSRLLQELARHDTWQVPTLTLMVASKEPYFIDDEWRATFDALPKSVAQRWRTSTERFKEIFKKPSAARDQRIKVAEWKMRMIKQLLESEVQIMAGTDAPLFYLTPGYSLHKELQTLANAGMTPLQALASATIAPAKYFNLQQTQGLIDKNMLADLVLLNSNPLEDISNTTDINMVIKGGDVLDRAALDRLLVSD